MEEARLTLRVFIVGLAAWRVASLLANEDGPGDVFGRLRHLIGIRPMEPIVGFLPLLFSCVWCIGFWCAVALWVAPPVVAGVLAASTVVILVERAVRG